ncbi:tRNA (32-2'-O)-methyltransferase regulator THADA-like [Diadema setosum]|uniref:tRNA (32-2'-O)-methyltransferase regulator THADA-like n=1 Tax=Diadema setosum TaxID=31175 RepID=UPI003B3A9442
MNQCLSLVKTSMTVIQKSYGVLQERVGLQSDSVTAPLEQILRLLTAILKTDTFLADCQAAAGMLFALIVKVLSRPLERVELISSSLYPHHIEHSPTHTSDRFVRLQGLLSALDVYASSATLSRLYVCHGFLVMLDPGDLLQELGTEGRTLLLDVLFPEIYSLTSCIAAQISSTNSNQSFLSNSGSLPAARTLSQWVTVAVEALTANDMSSHLKGALSGHSPISQKLLDYVTTNWDHPVDGLRHQTKSIFEGLVKLHISTLHGAAPHMDPFLLTTLARLVTTDRHTRGKYAPLGCLAEAVGAQHVAALYPGLLAQLLDVMGEHTMATHACEVIEKLFTQHKRTLQRGDGDSLLEWQTTWVVPILQELSDQTKPDKQKGFIIDYLIPKLLKSSPESLVFIIKHLSGHTFPSMNNVTVESWTAPGEERRTNSKVPDAGKLGALLSCLKTSRVLGLLPSSCEGRIATSDCRLGEGGVSGGEMLWKGLVPVSLLQRALCHSVNQIRLDAIGLLCDSSKTTEGVIPAELDLLTISIPFNLSNPSPSFRQQLVTHIKKLLLRLRESGRILLKNSSEAKSSSSDKTTSTDMQVQYQNFLQWLCSIAFHGLAPGFGYARRATSLHFLAAVTNTFSNSAEGLFKISSIWSKERVALMFAMLRDNYESNRDMAFKMLCGLPQDVLGLKDQASMHSLYTAAVDLATSSKPYNCETAAYALLLLARQTSPGLPSQPSSTVETNTLWMMGDLNSQLEEQVKVARRSLLEASVQGPMYGLLHCLRILLGVTDLRCLQAVESWRETVGKIISLALRVADVAATVVCNSSPEGFIPSEEKPGVENNQHERQPPTLVTAATVTSTSQLETFHVTPQMILVCCWRSMKEVSLLLGELSLRAPLMPETSSEGSSEGIISNSQMESIGSFFMKLLKESKHRGAFELAYAGFIKLTTRLWSEEGCLHQLLWHWLSGLLQEITSNQSMLCATRRSAGIPFAIQALVGPEPKELGKPCFNQSMKQLLSLAEPSQQQDDTARVHALNILRALFRDTRLGQEVLPYVADGMKVAILGFAAKLWAVRNSATMLFSALISRIFGVKRARDELARKNCMTGTEFFTRFPSLHGFLLDQFRQAERVEKKSRQDVTVLHPSLFPCLLLLSKLYPSSNDSNDANMSMAPFLPYIICAGCSAVYKTRSIATTALVPLVPLDQLVPTLLRLLDMLPGSAKEQLSQNTIHGVLMQINGLLSRHSRDAIIPGDIAEDIVRTVLPRIQQLIWLASSQNTCFVTRAAFAAIIKDFCLDCRWLQQLVPASQRYLKRDVGPGSFLGAVVELIKAEILGGEFHSHLPCSHPGFLLWQATFTSLCLMVHSTLASATSLQQEGYSDFWKAADTTHSTTRPCLQQHQQQWQSCPPDNIPAPQKQPHTGSPSVPNSLHSTSASRSPYLFFLSSPFLEVKLVTLTHLIQEMEHSSCTDNSGRPSHFQHHHRGVQNAWLLYHRLMDMLMEEHEPECLSKLCQALRSLVPMMHHQPFTSDTSSSGPTLMEPVSCIRLCLHLAQNHTKREEIVSAAVSLSGAFLPPVIAASGQDGTDEEQAVLLEWTQLMMSCSDTERSSWLRLSVAQLLADLALPLVVEGPVLHRDDDPRVQGAAVQCLTRVSAEVYAKLRANSKQDLLAWDLHPCLLLYVAPYLLTLLSPVDTIIDCIKLLHRWATEGVEKDESSAPNEMTGKEEEQINARSLQQCMVRIQSDVEAQRKSLQHFQIHVGVDRELEHQALYPRLNDPLCRWNNKSSADSPCWQPHEPQGKGQKNKSRDY